MGVYARIETTRGIWKAPAGDEAVPARARSTSRPGCRTPTTRTWSSSESSTASARSPAPASCVDASRTLSTDTRWLYVNVRLLFNYVKSSLRRRPALGPPGAQPRHAVELDQVRHGDPVPDSDCGARARSAPARPSRRSPSSATRRNNPPDQVDQGKLTVEVYFYPSNPAETIVIIVGQQPGVRPVRRDQLRRGRAGARPHQNGGGSHATGAGGILGVLSRQRVLPDDRRDAEPRRHRRSPGSARASSTRSSSPTAAPTTSTRSPPRRSSSSR